MTWCLFYTMYFPSVLVDLLLLAVTSISSSAKRDHIGVLEDGQITSLLKELAQFLGKRKFLLDGAHLLLDLSLHHVSCTLEFV